VPVYLVGAGPGDPGLLTVRAAEVLAAAEVVMYDSLAEVTLLDLAPATAERIFVGKRPGAPMPQEEINDQLIEHGRAGRRVVRLKGGDPFVFGRGGEEAQALLAAGVPFEVIPGVTSAVAVPAYAGIPVTHRGLSTSFTVVTGHSRHAVDTETNWEALAIAGGTIVVLMGVAHRAEIAARLIAGGLSPQTPVAAIRWGTRPEQHTTRATLGDLGVVDLQPPVTIVIGQVAALDLTDPVGRPLAGRRVIVTRARAQVSELADRLQELGAEVVQLPVITIADPQDAGVALRDAAARVSTYDWVVVSSANAVQRLAAELRDARAWGAARIAAVGSATAAALREHGLVADLVPERFVAEGLAEVFPEGAGRVLIPRAQVARDVLPDVLRAKGWTVDVVDAYRTVPAQPTEAEVEAAAGADAVMFTSSSTVRYFLDLGVAVPPIVACMGPVTAQAAADAGLAVNAVAVESTIGGLIEALLRALRIG